jgi:hypothetical protein
MTAHVISANSSTTPVLSVVPTGAPGATVNSTQITAIAVGSTFTVNIRVDNIGSVSAGIDGLSYNLTYDPTVLKVSSYHSKQASFWGSDSSDVTSVITQHTPGIFTEGSIIVPSGAPNEATNTPGVATQITFTVLTIGESNLTFEPSDVGIAYLDYPNSAGVSLNVVANTVNALYGSSSLGSVHGPVANFSPADGSSFTANTTVNLDASSSQPGFDTQTCNITNYLWSIEYLNGTTFTSLTGETATFNAAIQGTFRIILIVTANDTQSPPNPNYTATNSASALINVVSNAQSTNLDIFTDKSGVGTEVNGGLYGPLELLQMYASVTNNNAPIVDQSVLFTVQNSNNTIIAVRQGITNDTGIASAQFRLPTPDPSAPQNSFGMWSITASGSVTGVTISKATNFTFDYESGISNVTIPSSIHILQTLPIQLTINNAYLSAQWTQLSITLFDQTGIPIGSTTISTTQQTANITVIDASITIPSWAFTGQATAYFCLLTNTTSTQSIPISPETTASFQILP